MKKTVFVLILVLLWAGMAPPLTAQASADPLIIDDLGILSASGLNELNDYAREISDAYQLDVAFYLVENTSGQTLPQYIMDRYLYVEKMNPDGFALAHDPENRKWTFVSFGKAESLITEDDEDRFWDVYDETDTYYAGILAYLEAVSVFLAWASEENPAAAETAAEPATETTAEPADPPVKKNIVPPEEVRHGYVFDETGILTAAQIATLNEKAAALEEKRHCSAYIWVVDLVPNEYAEYANGSFNIDGLEAYVDEFYARNGLGYGSGKNGMVLLLEIGDVPGRRDYLFATYGACTSVFNNSAREKLLDDHIVLLFKKAFSDGNFFEAADTFLVKVEEKFAFSLMLKLAAIILIPMIIAFITCQVWKKQMKTAKIATTAANYIPAGGFKLTGQSDVFMYRTTSRTKIESSSSSGGGGGGSSSSSSGRSSGGRV